MIPIRPGATLEVEHDGVTYRLRYLTEEQYQIGFMQLQDQWSAARKPYVERARKNLEKHKPALPKGEDADNLLMLEVERLMQADADFVAKQIQYNRRLVDIFVVGWSGPNVAELPKDTKPSDCFGVNALPKLQELIYEHVVELTGLTEDEAKKS